MLSLQLGERAKLCSHIKVLGKRFRLPVERLDFSIDIIGRLEGPSCFYKTMVATRVAEEGPIVQLTVLDCRSLFVGEEDRLSHQGRCSFIKCIRSHTGCYRGVNSESVPEIFTYTSFPAMHITLWVGILDLTPSVGFAVREMAFNRPTFRWVHQPSLAIPLVICYVSIVLITIMV